jgi:hypothetical protein
MLVYICSNYSYPDLLRQTPGNKGEWEGIQFTFEEVAECDFVVVINHSKKDIKVKCRKGGKILLIQEPPYERNNYLKLHFRFYDTIISGFKNPGAYEMLNKQAALPWHIDKTYDELSRLTIDQQGVKKDTISFITSNSNIYPEHTVRLNFIEYMKSQSFNFDLFGRGFQPISNKFEGIYPYKYTIAAENYIGKDYFTEKIIDAFLSLSMPVYYGCPNITDYFPAEAMILVDMNKPGESLEKIKEAIATKAWDKNKDAILHAKELVLNKYQLFPMLQEVIKNKLKTTEKVSYEKVFLPHSGLTRVEHLKKKVKTYFFKK